VFVAALYVIWKLPDEKKFVPLRICITLITAGAAGNLIDRVAQGYVVDFLYFILIDFPIFNVADCYVTVATAVLLILLMKVYSDEDLAVLWQKRKES
jgi:signal peptidase II